MAAFHAMTVSIYRLCCLFSLIMFGLLAPALAQVTTTITPDGSLGTTVTQNGSAHTINGGTILGPNQFHSFDRFDVGTGDTANFTGPASIENILSRVTGGAASMIDGTLQSDIAEADLYVLNPSGVMFGPNARLDVMGSFHVSTADMLRLGEDGTFHGLLAEQSVLSVSTPSAFGFLQNDPAGIRLEGSRLAVPVDQILSIVGGDIEIAGNRDNLFNDAATLAAPSGQLHLVSVASAGEVVSEKSNTEPSVTVDGFARLGTLTITEAALVDVSSESGAGTVFIRGDNLLIENALIFADTLGDANGDELGINIVVTGIVMMATANSFIATGTLSRDYAAGNGGSILLEANQVSLNDGAQIFSRTEGPGHSGSVTVTAIDAVTLNGANLDGISSVIATLTTGLEEGAGEAGALLVEANQVSLNGGGRILSLTRGPGHAGSVTVNVMDTVAMASSNPDVSVVSGIASDTIGQGDAGDVTIIAPRLNLTVGAQISSSTRGTGQTGNIRIIATEAVTIQGEIRTPGATFPSGIFAIAVETESGSAGNVEITTPHLTLLDGGTIETSARTQSTGRAGTISLDVDTLTLEDFAKISSSTGNGAGGNITITASEMVVLASDSLISTFALGSGDAGKIHITTPNLSLSGIITGLSSDTLNSTGNAGTILLDVGTLTLEDGADISSSTSTEGAGGNVTIIAAEAVMVLSTRTEVLNHFLGNVP